MAGENNNQAVRVYSKQFMQLLQAVYAKRAYFGDIFGTVQALDGVSNNKTAMSIKTSDIPVAVQEYSTDKNTAFGTGTGSSSRFGERTEVIYTDTDVPFSWNWAIHEGVDRSTVNADFQSAVADRLDLQAQAKVQLFDDKASAYLSSIAGEKKLADYSPEKVLALFNDLSSTYVNLQTVGVKVAKVRPELYNAIIDHPITTTAKSSSANIDENGIVTFKGFKIQEVPDDKFAENELAIVAIQNIGRQFTGIDTVRTMESEDFNGVALQGAGQAGEYIIPANRKAVLKVVKGTAVPEA